MGMSLPATCAQEEASEDEQAALFCAASSLLSASVFGGASCALADSRPSAKWPNGRASGLLAQTHCPQQAPEL